MNSQNLPGENSELAALRAEVAKLKNERTALEAQTMLLENLVTMASTPSEEGVLKKALQQTLDLAADLTGAEKGSLFILDPAGKIVDAILTRAEVTPEQRDRLIGNVLDKGLAGWVSRHRQIGSIADTETDDRWVTLPNQPYQVRSALGIPILRGGELLGILTLLHSAPNHFTNKSAALMQATTNQIALVLENARLYSKLNQYAKALDAELEKGRQIQIDFLPYEIPQLPNWEIATCFHPAKQCAGDFYDVFELSNGHVGLVIADVCDKGVGAALFMALFRSLIRIFSKQSQLEGSPSDILQENQPSTGWICDCESINLAHINALSAIALTNDYVGLYHWQMSMFATVFFAVLDPATGLLTYINGGHEPVFVVGDKGVKLTLPSTGPAVGMMPKMKFGIQQVQLEPGDILISYTDGVTEAKSPEGKLFTDKRLRELIENQAASASELLERIKSSLFAYMDDAPQFDDITMLAVHRYPSVDRQELNQMLG
ncbi:MAG: PP2C family protein-serine/threonine phosphatase [Hormoscilla sp.]